MKSTDQQSAQVFAPVFSGKVRRQGLDVMRALAVFLVIGHHAAYRFPPIASDPIAQVLKYSGWIGVDIFFAISGFMITGILIRDRSRRDITGFFVRRFYRIIPLFALAMFSFTILSFVTGAELEKIGVLWSPALLLNGWTIPFLGYENVPYGITWSLSVEETAYVILGLACLRVGHRLQVMLLSFLIVSIALRWVIVFTGALDLFELYFFVPARLDSIALGGFGALGWYGRIMSLRHIGVVATLAMFTLIWLFQFVPLKDPLMPLVGYAIFGLVCAILVARVGLGKSGPKNDNRRVGRPLVAALAKFGKLSYFIYLFHLFVLEGLKVIQVWLPGVELSYWSAVLLTCAATFGLATISWRYFEFPLIQHSKSWGQPKPTMRESLPAED